ncbi:hypothetical protein QA641_13485 [Bradyrhizobium sp. CB1650]|uniref:hypothetical protein n=1 Tax=Bradyrhizobium sp. CB1650 TaxID=3039153 RepID=UPI002435479F|nr:hypothetical protein [Bradyrhizobium sp. CB1650]WGD54834.1 hypothetical protein QA641_13485 [Bradyrhizobium sp. CB1650]
MAAPLMVSNARIEIKPKNFMAPTSVPIVAKNVNARCNFRTIPGKIVACDGASPEVDILLDCNFNVES